MKNIQNHSVAYDTPTPITPIFFNYEQRQFKD